MLKQSHYKVGCDAYPGLARQGRQARPLHQTRLPLRSDQDCYGCPAGQALTFRFQTVEQDREIRYYATSACGHCPIKAQCTRNKRGRRITRWVDEHLLEAMQARVQAEPEKVGLRKQLAEHPFGTIKHAMNQGYFLMRGLEKVRAEMALTVMAYNLKRAIKILGVPEMVAALA